MSPKGSTGSALHLVWSHKHYREKVVTNIASDSSQSLVQWIEAEFVHFGQTGHPCPDYLDH
eukprot:6466772-Amphidinium_carterae.2